jgi:hypothetical protein
MRRGDEGRRREGKEGEKGAKDESERRKEKKFSTHFVGEVGMQATLSQTKSRRCCLVSSVQAHIINL